MHVNGVNTGFTPALSIPTTYNMEVVGINPINMVIKCVLKYQCSKQSLDIIKEVANGRVKNVTEYI